MTTEVHKQAKQAVLANYRWVDGHADLWRVFADPVAFSAVIAGLAEPFVDSGVTAVTGVESRGFLLGGAVAARLGVGFVGVRKREGLFPGNKAVRRSNPDYRGNAHVLRIQRESLNSDDRVLLVDDWLETGNQARTAAALIADCGATLAGCSVIVDQLEMTGAAPITGEVPVHALVDYSELPIPECCVGKG